MHSSTKQNSANEINGFVLLGAGGPHISRGAPFTATAFGASQQLLNKTAEEEGEDGRISIGEMDGGGRGLRGQRPAHKRVQIQFSAKYPSLPHYRYN